MHIARKACGTYEVYYKFVGRLLEFSWGINEATIGGRATYFTAVLCRHD